MVKNEIFPERKEIDGSGKKSELKNPIIYLFLYEPREKNLDFVKPIIRYVIKRPVVDGQSEPRRTHKHYLWLGLKLQKGVSEADGAV